MTFFSLFKGRLHGHRRCGLRRCGLKRCGPHGVWPQEVWPHRVCDLRGVASGGVTSVGVASGSVASVGVATGLKTPEFKDDELWPKTFVRVEFKLTGSGVFLCFDSDHSVILWFFMV